MVAKMDKKEFEQITLECEKMKNMLFTSSDMKNNVMSFMDKKDDIIRKLGFNEELDLVITYINLLNVSKRYLKEVAGFNHFDKETIVHTKGTTTIIDKILELHKKEQNMIARYKREYKRYTKEYLKMIKKR